MAVNARGLFTWGLEHYRLGVSQIGPDGTMPLEMARKSKARHYHNFALMPFVLIAEVAAQNGVDLYGESSARGTAHPEALMARHTWVQDFAGAITVCDPDGVILEMNAQAARAFEDQGGAALIGTNMLDCHPEPARTKTQELLDTRRTNVYTIEKRGQKKLVYQAPWYRDGQYCGFTELVLEIPAVLPHFVREP